MANSKRIQQFVLNYIKQISASNYSVKATYILSRRETCMLLLQ